MTPIDLLAAPIRVLLDAVGTGSAGPADPASALRGTSAALDRTGESLRGTAQVLDSGWQSVAATEAQGQMDRHRQQTSQTSRDGTDMAAIIDEAAVTVRHAATELRAILDSFVSAANALGPALYSPAGIALILPAAVEHLQRALAVVNRTRAELDRQGRRLSEIHRHTAPGKPGQVSSAAAAAGHGSTAAKAGSGPAGAKTRSAGLAGDAAGVGRAGGPPTPGAVPITLPDGSVAYAPNQRAATAVRAALSQRGVPYVWGGTSPGKGLDCSGLTQYAYRQAGIELPRLAQDQDTAGYRVDQSELLPGDLAVWSGHVAMYIGNNEMVEAGDPVQVSPVRTTNSGQSFEGFYRPR